MAAKFTELKCKEVICVSDGRRLGFIADVLVKIPEGCVTALIVPGEGRCLGLMGRQHDYVIPWSAICRVGPDIVLVDADPDACRRPRQKDGMLF